MIDIYVMDIKKSLSNQCYFSALSLSLTLPDICGSVEFPDKQVAERYIGWYDRYVSQYVKDVDEEIKGPWLSGEMVYNLRNTFLHQGSPNIDADKVKEESNKLDKFILVLGDGKNIQELTLVTSYRSAAFRMIVVDMTYLCEILCACSLEYYNRNSDKFKFDFTAIHQDHLYGSNSPLDDIHRDNDPIVEILNQKLSDNGEPVRIQGDLSKSMCDAWGRAQMDNRSFMISKDIGFDCISSESQLIQKLKKKNGSKTKKKAQSKEEQQLRCFFGRTFTEEKFKKNKEQIISAVLNAKTKTELNRELMKILPGSDVKIILKRLKPVIKDWPGN